MSKKPASLTSDLLARKGEAEPSTIDPSARMTLSAGSGFSDSGGGHGEYPDDHGTGPRAGDIRPMPPEPEIIYTAEETRTGASNMRLIIFTVLGLIIAGGIFLAVTGNQQGGVAPVSPDVAAKTPAPQDDPQNELSPKQQLIDAAQGKAETPATSTTPPSTETPASPNETTQAAPREADEAPAPAPVAEAAPEAAAPVKTVEPAAPAKVAVSPQAGGAYVVQLLALRDEGSARAAWKKISAKHSGILEAHALDIEKADLGSKGIWYRVRAAGFASKLAATRACNGLKATGQDCIVKKR